MHPRIAVVFALLLARAATADAPKDPYAAIRDQVARVVGQVYEGNGLAQLTDLSDTVGARVTGSPGYTAATQWASAQLRAAGATHVHLEKLTLEHGWVRGAAKARVIAPLAQPLHVESVGWSPSTPSGGVRGQVVMVSALDPANAVPTMKGRIVLAEHIGDASGGHLTIAVRKSLVAYKAAGAVAVIVDSSHSLTSNVLFTGSATDGGKLAPLPLAVIGMEDGQRIARQLATGPVTVTLELANQISGPVEVANVVGELAGSTPEWLLIGAHLDSWDLATGTQDNGAGVVQVLQAARALAGAGPLKRGIRFALWAGEEQNLIGSHAFAVAHEAELAKCVAAINIDSGAGHVQGWQVEGRKDVKAALEPISKGLLAGLGGDKIDMDLEGDSNQFSFVTLGVPALSLVVDSSHYGAIHHTPADTIDKVDAHDLASGASVIAATALALATSTQAFAPHLDRAAVTELLKPDGYDESLELDGWWK